MALGGPGTSGRGNEGGATVTAAAAAVAVRYTVHLVAINLADLQLRIAQLYRQAADAFLQKAPVPEDRA